MPRATPEAPSKGVIVPDRVPILDADTHKVILCQYRIAPGCTLYMVELWLPGFDPTPVRSRLTRDEWRAVGEALSTIDGMLSIGESE